ncbi:MAG: M48 family metalloprotease, partial [Deltaproteobacteria bacterium]|nr:M48 family metalloprotease [Deltaproteobacteria bacterium]
MFNTLRTTFLLGLLTGLLILIGGYFGGQGGMILALVVAGAMNIGAYWFSDRIVLSMYRAKPLEEHQAPELFTIVRRLTQAAGLPMPRIAVIPQEAPNAFATGRDPDHAVVAVTQGLVRLLDSEELTGVLAHEVGHIKNRDILIGSVAATLAGAVMVLASMARWAAIFGLGRDDDDEGGGLIGLLLTAIVAPVAALLIQMAISRSREFKADQTGAALAGSPHGLAGALAKLDRASRRLPMAATPQT